MFPFFKTAPILIILSATILMQIHSIAFWTEYTNPYVGWAWSLTLEAAALWLWYHSGVVYKFFAILASSLLLLGPLYQLSAPVFVTQDSDIKTQLLITNQKQEIQQLELSLQQFLNNSDKRIGWAKRIDRTQDALDTARNRLRQLHEQKSSTQSWQVIAITIMQACILCVVMGTQILAINALRSIPFKHYKEPGFDGMVDYVSQRINKLLPNFEGKQNKLAEHFDFRPADVSLVRNHVDRIAQGRDVISEAALRRMYNVLRAV